MFVLESLGADNAAFPITWNNAVYAFTKFNISVQLPFRLQKADV